MQLMELLQEEWPGDTYDFLRREISAPVSSSVVHPWLQNSLITHYLTSRWPTGNCCHFCDELCARLSPGNAAEGMPRWLNRFARSGATLADSVPAIFKR